MPPNVDLHFFPQRFLVQSHTLDNSFLGITHMTHVQWLKKVWLFWLGKCFVKDPWIEITWYFTQIIEYILASHMPNIDRKSVV